MLLNFLQLGLGFITKREGCSSFIFFLMGGEFFHHHLFIFYIALISLYLSIYLEKLLSDLDLYEEIWQQNLNIYLSNSQFYINLSISIFYLYIQRKSLSDLDLSEEVWPIKSQYLSIYIFYLYIQRKSYQTWI